MSNAATARINLSSLRHNLSRVRELSPSSKIYAVVKSNGYGHGLIETAKALSEADGLAVARIEEALVLRQKGITQGVLVLGGVYDDITLRRAVAQKMELVVHHQSQVELLTKKTNGSSLRGTTLWIKMDTGMHRLGFAPEYFEQVLQRLQSETSATHLVAMTHLANADDIKDDRTKVQFKRFQNVMARHSVPLSIANSAGIMAWPTTHVDIVRPGIMLYGSSPLNQKTSEQLNLRPVMTLVSRLIAIRKMKKGDHVGYGGAWVCPEDMRLGVVSIGYGDGYPRHAKTGTPILVNGILTQLVGRVSMDMICVDLRPCADAEVFDEVVLWGEGLSADIVAKHADTIAYELFCGITQRVEFEYRDG